MMVLIPIMVSYKKNRLKGKGIVLQLVQLHTSLVEEKKIYICRKLPTDRHIFINLL